MTIAANNIRPNQGDSLVISVEELKKVYLFGVDLTDDDGNDFPKEMFEFYIRAAQSWLETQLPGICLTETAITSEVHDYYAADYYQYSFLKINRFPVRSISRVAVQFPLAPNPMTFDDKWYRVDSQGGHVNLVPSSGSIGTILLSQYGNFLPLFSGIDFLPAFWQVDYVAGYSKNQCPPVLRHLVGLKAMQGPLNIAGDLIAGAGIASKSLSMDGISQSINTTASAENTGYGARITQANRDLKEALTAAHNSFVGIQFTVA